MVPGVAPGDGPPRTVVGDVTCCVPSRLTNFGGGDPLSAPAISTVRERFMAPLCVGELASPAFAGIAFFCSASFGTDMTVCLYDGASLSWPLWPRPNMRCS